MHLVIDRDRAQAKNTTGGASRRRPTNALPSRHRSSSLALVANTLLLRADASRIVRCHIVLELHITTITNRAVVDEVKGPHLIW